MSNLLHKGRQSSSLKAANRGKAKVKRLNLEIYRGTERASERERERSEVGGETESGTESGHVLYSSSECFQRLNDTVKQKHRDNRILTIRSSI